MKTLNAIVKVITALAAVAGAVYVVATYGDQIVAWAKKVLANLPECPCCHKSEVVISKEFTEEETPVEEVPTEEAPVEEPAVEEPSEEPAGEAPAAEPAPNEPVAEDNDFAE